MALQIELLVMCEVILTFKIFWAFANLIEVLSTKLLVNKKHLSGVSDKEEDIHDINNNAIPDAGTANNHIPECPRGQGAVHQFNGVHNLPHITPSGSGYFENVWAWTADHDLDKQGQIFIYTVRGVLIEFTEGSVWLYVIQSEQRILYQLTNTCNVFMTMILSETPYWQPGPPEPQPCTPAPVFDDPTYSHCAVGDISTSNYNQTCLDTDDCQTSMVELENNNAFYMYNINTNAAINTVDTSCINTAISSGDRCGINCDSSTIVPALIYFPSERYLISSKMIMYYYNQLVGNAKNPPTLVAPPGFNETVLDSNPYGVGGRNWYTNQNSFFRQVRNFVIDMTEIPTASETTRIHWQVDQVTFLVNIHFFMNIAPGRGHRGICIENVSGDFMSDLKFTGGRYGMLVGNQQFLSINIDFDECDTTIYMSWKWQWTFKNVNIRNVRVGTDMHSTSDSAQSNNGLILLVGSSISDAVIGILQCNGVHTLRHITPSRSANFGNVWALTTDHNLDRQGQISTYTGRGVLTPTKYKDNDDADQEDEIAGNENAEKVFVKSSRRISRIPIRTPQLKEIIRKRFERRKQLREIQSRIPVRTSELREIILNRLLQLRNIRRNTKSLEKKFKKTKDMRLLCWLNQLYDEGDTLLRQHNHVRI